jgi:hypothetical protein
VIQATILLRGLFTFLGQGEVWVSLFSGAILEISITSSPKKLLSALPIFYNV